MVSCHTFASSSSWAIFDWVGMSIVSWGLSRNIVEWALWAATSCCFVTPQGGNFFVHVCVFFVKMLPLFICALWLWGWPLPLLEASLIFEHICLCKHNWNNDCADRIAANITRLEAFNDILQWHPPGTCTPPSDMPCIPSTKKVSGAMKQTKEKATSSFSERHEAEGDRSKGQSHASTDSSIGSPTMHAGITAAALAGEQKKRSTSNTKIARSSKMDKV